jgi:T5orf172 domain
MSLFGTKEKQEIAVLQNEIAALKAQLTPEHITLAELNQEIEASRVTLETVYKSVVEKKALLKELESQIIETDETVMLQSFGLYTPRYSFMRADEYKARLLEIRANQKDMIKSKTAVTGSTSWTVNNSAAKGKKMVSDMQKLLLRAFNAECDDIVEHVKFNNLETSEKRITTSKDAISKLGDMMGISITPQYYRLKIEELYLAFEYQQKKQQEKEAQKEERARMREEAKLAKELEEARKALEKEQTHYLNALKKLDQQMADHGETPELLEKKSQIEIQLEEIEKSVKEVDYREANQKAGYVYVISNIGAFGENVFKIGMTRRLDPMERIDELGDASVPFNFDVHAMIFAENAPKLEAALHNAFSKQKVNFINQRREFFNVSLDDIKRVVKENFDKTVEFVDVAPAEQYRQSLLMKEEPINRT